MEKTYGWNDKVAIRIVANRLLGMTRRWLVGCEVAVAS